MCTFLIFSPKTHIQNWMRLKFESVLYSKQYGIAFGKNVQLLNIKPNGTYSNHCVTSALEGKEKPAIHFGTVFMQLHWV
jgi:hypothetical protein